MLVKSRRTRKSSADARKSFMCSEGGESMLDILGREPPGLLWSNAVTANTEQFRVSGRNIVVLLGVEECGQPCLRYCRRGESIVTKPRFRCVKERTQNVSIQSRIFGTDGETRSTSSSLMP